MNALEVFIAQTCAHTRTRARSQTHTYSHTSICIVFTSRLQHMLLCNVFFRIYDALQRRDLPSCHFHQFSRGNRATYTTTTARCEFLQFSTHLRFGIERHICLECVVSCKCTPSISFLTDIDRVLRCANWSMFRRRKCFHCFGEVDYIFELIIDTKASQLNY